MTVSASAGPPGVEADSPYHIGSSVSFHDRRPRALKQGHTFAVFDPRGDMAPADGNSDGLYHRDTRYLSRFELRLDGAPLLLLSSNVQQDNSVLSVDLANPELGNRHLHGELIQVNRLIFIWSNVLYQRILIRNFDREAHAVFLTVKFGADFADLFEVRGQKRSRRGQVSCECPSRSTAALRYLGLDRVERITTLCFDPPPSRLDPTTALFRLTIEPLRPVRLVLRVACGEAAPVDRADRQIYRALRTARRALRVARSRAVGLESSNSLFNELAGRSIADLYMLLTETEEGPYPFAGIPWFNTAFGRDGLITALFTLWLDPTIAKGVLGFLAATQARRTDARSDAEPGKILHEMRDGEMARLGEVPFARYYGSVDTTPLFLMLLGEYFRRTGDLEAVRRLWPSAQAALHWIDAYGDPDGDGFVEYQRRAEDGLDNQGWKDSHDAVFHADGRPAKGPIALCEVQAYVYAAKRHAAVIAAALGDCQAAAALRRQAERLRERFEAAFWCEELSTYALALDGDKKPCRVVASNAGHALFAGIAAPERAERVAETLLGAACFSGWGVRTLAVTAPRYNPMSYHNGSVWPHDNALIALGFARYGLKPAVLKVVKGLFDAAGYMDLLRLPELFCGFPRRMHNAPTLYPVACIPQAWASASVFALVQACLGLKFDHGAGEIRFDHPVLPEFLNELSLRGLTTQQGEVDVLLHRFGLEVAVTITRRIGKTPITVSH
jgi:glycogen debranching enzyme